MTNVSIFSEYELNILGRRSSTRNNIKGFFYLFFYFFFFYYFFFKEKTFHSVVKCSRGLDISMFLSEVSWWIITQ